MGELISVDGGEVSSEILLLRILVFESMVFKKKKNMVVGLLFIIIINYIMFFGCMIIISYIGSLVLIVTVIMC